MIPRAPRWRPILFTAAMVRAILAGTKTVTRRLIALREFQPSDTPGYDWTFRDRSALWQDFTSERMLASSPYGVRGDMLWVRETWGLHAFGDETDWARGSVRDCSEDEIRSQYHLTFRADWGPLQEGARWRPGIFMPRWASRIALAIESVRIERLLDITDDDARREGVEPFFTRFPEIGRDQRITDGMYARDEEHRASFACTWDEINGDRALWNTNPFVWRVEFRRLEHGIKAVAA